MTLADFSDSDAALNEKIMNEIDRINDSENYPDLEIKNTLLLKKSYKYIKDNDFTKEEFSYRSDLPKDRYDIPPELASTKDKKYVLKCIFTFWSFDYEITKARLVEGDRFSTDNMIKSVIGRGKLYSYIENEFESYHHFLSFIFDINYIYRAFYYDIDWDRAKILLENGLTKRALARKIGIRFDLIDEVIERHIGEYERADTYIQLSYDKFSKLYNKEKELLGDQAEFYELYETGVKELEIPESTLTEYINKKELRDKANISEYSHRKKLEKLETIEDYKEKSNTYESEEKILRSIDFPVYWLHGFGADMIHDGKVVEIKRSLTSNSLYKAIVQSVFAYRKLSKRDGIEEKAIYVTRIEETEEHYWKKYAETFNVNLYVLNDGNMELAFDPEKR